MGKPQDIVPYNGKQYANLSAGAWRQERPEVADCVELGEFLKLHGLEHHSVLQWDRMWGSFLNFLPDSPDDPGSA